MNSLETCELLAKHPCDLSETSRGGINNEALVSCSYPAVSIDDAMHEYARSFPGLDGFPPSADALVGMDSSEPLLVEFKSGKNIDKGEIRGKLMSTLLMLGELGALTLEQSRSSLEFVLVYKRSVQFGAGSNQDNPCMRVQDSAARGSIIASTLSLARNNALPRKLSGMENGMEKIFVRRFSVLSEREFEEKIRELSSGL